MGVNVGACLAKGLDKELCFQGYTGRSKVVVRLFFNEI